MSNGLLAKLGNSLRRRGVLGTARHAIQMGADMVGSRVRHRRRRRIRLAIDDSFDREHGVDTGGSIPRSELGVDGKSAEGATYYEATYPEPFFHIFRQLPIDFRQAVFVDFGSGKGRAILLAVELPFKKVVGVEFSPPLHEIAKENCRKYRSPTRQCETIDLLCMDAVEYAIPPEPAVLFFYNPFNEEIMRQVAGNVRRSLQAAPRRLVIVYFNPKHGGVWDSLESLKKFPVDDRAWPGYQGQRTRVWTT